MSWGPVLWSILHTSAEHLGKPMHPLIQTDETNRWVFLLKSVEEAMPCKLCRKHYGEWLKQHPLSQFSALRGPALRERARKWLYDLHENVNKSNTVVSGITLEALPEMYKSLAGYQAQIELFVKLSKESVQQGLVKAEGPWQFRNHLHYLRKLTGTI